MNFKGINVNKNIKWIGLNLIIFTFLFHSVFIGLVFNNSFAILNNDEISTDEAGKFPSQLTPERAHILSI